MPDTTPRLRSLNDLVREIEVPSELAFAFATDRVELLKLIKPGPLDAVDAAKLYEVIGVLMETNRALRLHALEMTRKAQALGEAVVEINAARHQLRSICNKAMETKIDIDHLASFRDANAAEEY